MHMAMFYLVQLSNSTVFHFLFQSLAVAFIQFGRKKGARTSGFLFCYWLLQVMAALLLVLLKIRTFVVEVRQIDRNGKKQAKF